MDAQKIIFDLNDPENFKHESFVEVPDFDICVIDTGSANKRFSQIVRFCTVNDPKKELLTFPSWFKFNEMSLQDLPGLNKNQIPLVEFDENWIACIWHKSEYVYFIQSNNPDQKIFNMGYCVDINLYKEKWKKALQKISTKESLE